MQEILKYQDIDLRLRKLESQLETNPNRVKMVEMQKYLKDFQAKLLKLEEGSKELTENYQKVLKTYKEYVEKLEQLTKNVNEYKGDNLEQLESAVANFTQKTDKLENAINVLGSRMTSVNNSYETVYGQAQKARRNLDICRENYNKEKVKLEPEIKKLQDEKEKQKAKVDPKLLEKYVSKYESKIFPVFVPETNGRCGGCHMEIPAGEMSLLRTKGLIECQSCSRIIYKL